MDINYDNIPDDMKDAGYWVVWRYMERNGKQTKVPVDVNTGNNARSNDARTWATFSEARAYLESHPDIDGLGFMFGNEYTGIDVDHISDWKANPARYDKLMKMINSSDTYCEYSPSGDGLHLIYKARKPGKRCSRDGFEMWDHQRYFTVTGDHFGDTPLHISSDEDKVKDFYNEFLDDGMQQTKNAVDAIADGVIHQVDRRQQLRNGYRDPKSDKRFARIPRGAYTCDWCIMLASQGFQYLTQETAIAPGHNFCDCAIVAHYNDTTSIEGYDQYEYMDYYEKNLRSKYTSKEYYANRDARRGQVRAPGGGVIMTEQEYLDNLKDADAQAALNKMSKSSKQRLKKRQSGNN